MTPSRSRDMDCMDSFCQQLQKREHMYETGWKCAEQAHSKQRWKFQTGDGLFFYRTRLPRPMFATSPTSTLRRKHCVSATGVRQRDKGAVKNCTNSFFCGCWCNFSPPPYVTKPVKRSPFLTAVDWSGTKFLPADRSSPWGRCFSPHSPGRKWIHSLAPSNSHCWFGN